MLSKDNIDVYLDKLADRYSRSLDRKLQLIL